MRTAGTSGIGIWPRGGQRMIWHPQHSSRTGSVHRWLSQNPEYPCLSLPGRQELPKYMSWCYRSAALLRGWWNPPICLRWMHNKCKGHVGWVITMGIPSIINWHVAHMARFEVHPAQAIIWTFSPPFRMWGNAEFCANFLAYIVVDFPVFILRIWSLQLRLGSSDLVIDVGAIQRLQHWVMGSRGHGYHSGGHC